MTDIQKKQVTELRANGYGYKKISQLTGISSNTVKSYCKRNGVVLPIPKETEDGCCPQCGGMVIQSGKTKKRRFCSDDCRKQWWKEHPNMASDKAVYSFVCDECGTTFTAYGNRNRKFCRHECYVRHRVKAGGYHDC